MNNTDRLICVSKGIDPKKKEHTNTTGKRNQHILHAGYLNTLKMCKLRAFEQHQQIGVIFVRKSRF